MEFGVQTFTIRKMQKSNMAVAYLVLKEMGISSLEIARIKFSEKNAYKVNHILSSYEMIPVSIQVKPKYVFGDPERVINFCKITGCKNVVISMLPFSCILGSDEKFYSFVDTLDKYYEIYEKSGITLAYHHHNWEYIRLSNGKTRMAELLSRTKKIKFVHDTYWTARSGVSPVAQINEFGDRLLGIHLRDLAFKKKFLDVVPHDTAVGEGVIDFKAVLEAAEQVGCEYTVIEQKSKIPYTDIELSLNNLKKISSESKE